MTEVAGSSSGSRSSLDQCRRNLSHAVRDGVNARQYAPCNKTLAGNHKTGPERGTIVPRHDAPRIVQGQTMPKKDKMEIEIAFKALAVFAAFMAGRSLTAYFKKSNSAAKRGTMAA